MQFAVMGRSQVLSEKSECYVSFYSVSTCCEKRNPSPTFVCSDVVLGSDLVHEASVSEKDCFLNRKLTLTVLSYFAFLLVF